LATGIAAPVIIGRGLSAAGQLSPQRSGARGKSAILDVDLRQLISRADLILERPVSRSEEGLPVGNGRMGSLVWTSPSALKFQINRVDVYGNDSYTNSFFKRHDDYCGGCGFVDIELGDLGEDVFPTTGFSQRLSIYDGLLELSGKGVTARV